MNELWSGSAAAILPVADLARAVAFYRGIGFDVDESDAGAYAFVESGGTRFHLSESPGFDPFVNAGMVYLYVDDPDAVHAMLGIEDLRLDHAALVKRWRRGESLARIRPVRDEPWGTREFSFADPDNNLVRVGTRLVR
ncbi:bleomycin resistance protein [Microbacterium rhizomatis]|uniref:Bleomycin resistance protein n=1 Tax=Microbacterium rhizomatis TaxID=1631477 RepID=A0A5J5IW04_9MICO|nr:VOC family protein [Microbacterium rhizomatis]KAA9105503.1 VOC family protein [Microbacterium rhizomatis]